MNKKSPLQLGIPGKLCWKSKKRKSDSNFRNTDQGLKEEMRGNMSTVGTGIPINLRLTIVPIPIFQRQEWGGIVFKHRQMGIPHANSTFRSKVHAVLQFV